MIFENSLSFAQQLDAADPLKAFRKEFIIPTSNGKEHIYFLGNSLGLQPVRTKGYLQEVLDAWSRYGVEAFFMGEKPWLQLHDQLTEQLSNLVGALPHEVVVMNQLTVNLHLLLASFYRPQGKRIKIICEAKAFPSDQYMLETHVRHYGFNPDEVIVEVQPRAGEQLIHIEDILQVIQTHRHELALILWGGVNYYTGQVFDMATITQAGHTAGAKVGFDLAHGAGHVPMQLHNWNVDFAAWCSYKYLNSGPGAISGAYIHERYHQDAAVPRLAGWWGYDKATRFLMDKGFKPIPTAEGWQLSTPSPLLYAAHKAALDITREAKWEAIQEKGRKLNSYLWFLLEQISDGPYGKVIEFITPRNERERGNQISMFMLQKGRAVFDALTDAHVMIDWREPNVIRLAPVPLYNTFEEVWQFTNILQQILTQQLEPA